MLYWSTLYQNILIDLTGFIMSRLQMQDPKWFLIDATNKRVGRLASKIAHILQGKHKSSFAPNKLDEDHLIVINAEKVVFTGKKWDQKEYIRHSGYLGGLKKRSALQVLKDTPERILTHAIKGMIPKNKMGRRIMKKIRIYSGSVHPHLTQKPSQIQL